jgi:hypothetical protein
MVTAAEVAAKMHDAGQNAPRPHVPVGTWSLAITFRTDIGYGVSAGVGGEVYKAHGPNIEAALVSLFAKLPTGGGE